MSEAENYKVNVQDYNCSDLKQDLWEMKEQSIINNSPFVLKKASFNTLQVLLSFYLSIYLSVLSCENDQLMSEWQQEFSRYTFLIFPKHSWSLKNWYYINLRDTLGTTRDPQTPSNQTLTAEVLSIVSVGGFLNILVATLLMLAHFHMTSLWCQ